jgi:hypothetical protein
VAATPRSGRRPGRPNASDPVRSRGRVWTLWAHRFGGGGPRHGARLALHRPGPGPRFRCAPSCRRRSRPLSRCPAVRRTSSRRCPGPSRAGVLDPLWSYQGAAAHGQVSGSGVTVSDRGGGGNAQSTFRRARRDPGRHRPGRL